MSKTKFDIAVFIENEEWRDDVPDAEEVCVNACRDTLVASGMSEHFGSMEVAITLAYDIFIKDLNKRFRNKDKPTNVLSFPNSEIRPGNYKNFPAKGDLMLGDIVVAHGVLLKEAEEQGKTVKNHLLHMVVHGTLHLLGFDHTTEKDAQKMEGIEIVLLKKYGIPNPYLLND